MHTSDHESRLAALQQQVARMEEQQVALLDLLHQLRAEVEALTQDLIRWRQGRR